MYIKKPYRTFLLFLISIFLLSVLQTRAQDNLKSGIAAVKTGDYVTAVVLLKKAVNSDPKSYDANLYYGIALYKTGSLIDAEKYLKQAIIVDEEKADAYAVLGEVYSEQKKYDAAAESFDNAKKYLPLNKTADALDPEEITQIVNTLSDEADNFIASGKVDKAIASLTQAKTYDKNNPLIYVGLGDAYLVRGAYEPAITNYKQSLTLNANFAPAYYGLGMVAFRQKKYNDAVQDFSKAIDVDKNFAEAYFEKGLLLYLSEEWNAALDAFKKYAELKPGSLRGNTYYAKTQYAMGRLDDAMTLLDEVLKIDTTYSEANKYKAYIYFEKKDYQNALTYFDKVKPEDYNAEDWTKRGGVLNALKDYPKAYDSFKKAIETDSTYADAYFEYGKAQFNDEKYQDALINFDKAISLGTTNLAAYVYKGICYYYLKDYDKAIEQFQKSIEVNDKFASSYLWLGNSYVASLPQYTTNKDTYTKVNGEAITAYKKVLELEPDNQDAKDQVIAAYKRVLELDPNNQDAKDQIIKLGGKL